MVNGSENQVNLQRPANTCKSDAGSCFESPKCEGVPRALETQWGDLWLCGTKTMLLICGHDLTLWAFIGIHHDPRTVQMHWKSAGVFNSGFIIFASSQCGAMRSLECSLACVCINNDRVKTCQNSVCGFEAYCSNNPKGTCM